MYVLVPIYKGGWALHGGFKSVELARDFGCEPVAIELLAVAGDDDLAQRQFAACLQRTVGGAYRACALGGKACLGQVKMQPYIKLAGWQLAQGSSAACPSGPINHATCSPYALALAQVQHGCVDATVQAKVIHAYAHTTPPRSHAAIVQAVGAG